MEGKAGAQIDPLEQVIDVADGPIARIDDRCGELNKEVKSAAIAANITAMLDFRKQAADEYAKVDNDLARGKARAEMKSPRRTLNTLLRDINIVSISPVVLFDAARIGGSTGPFRGTRYGIGGGLRFSLVSHVNLTVAYAANPDRRPGESRGAFVFTLQFRDLLD